MSEPSSHEPLLLAIQPWRQSLVCAADHLQRWKKILAGAMRQSRRIGPSQGRSNTPHSQPQHRGAARPVSRWLPPALGSVADWTSFGGANLADWPLSPCEIDLHGPIVPQKGARLGSERLASRTMCSFWTVKGKLLDLESCSQCSTR
jgi:hypothetical protein